MQRRAFLRQTVLSGVGLLAGIACAPTATPQSPTSPPAPTAAPPPPAASLSVAPSAVLAAPSAVPNPAGTGSLVSVHGVWPALTSKALIWAVTLEAGYFEKYGLDFQLDYINGSSAAAAAIISGSIDMAATGGNAVVTAQAAGQDLIMVAGFINEIVYRVMARPEIATIDDLRGKTVSVSRVGQTDYFVWQSVLQKLGWATDDLKYVNGNDQSGELALLEQGQTYAIAATPPQELAAAELGLHQILDTTTMGIPEQDVGIVLARPFLAAHHDVTLNVIKATIEGVHRWQQDKAFTEGVISKYLKSDDAAFIEDGYSAYAPLWPRVPFPSREGFAKVIEEVSTQSPAAADLTVDQLIDTSLVQELVDTGFIQQIYGSQ